MGFLMFLGMVSSGLYASHVLKNDIQAEISDHKTKTTNNTKKDMQQIKKMFSTICKRSGIKTSKNGSPIDASQCHKGIEYLKLQGYDSASIDYFVKIFNQRIKNHHNHTIKSISNELSQLYQELQQSPQPSVKTVWKRNYYGYDNIDERMEQIMNSHYLWKKLIKKEDCTYVTGSSGAKYTEIWHLYAPQDFLNKINLDDIYEKICWLYKIDNGNFR